MEVLPLQEMRQHWKKKEYREYLTIFNDWLHRCDWSAYRSLNDEKKQTIREQSSEALGRLTNLWESDDRKIHDLIQSVYHSSKKVKPFPIWRHQVQAYNEYLRRIFCTEVMRFANINISQFKELSEFLLDEIFLDEQTLKVEDKLRQFNVRSSYDRRYICDLQRISIEFMETLYIYPLDLYSYPLKKDYKDRTDPGVYFIYYIGQRKLYGGLLPSTTSPVYVGKLDVSISARLKIHSGKIGKAKNTFSGKDFIVRFMIVDIKYYACCIEGMIIEKLQPVWNQETVDLLNFGNAESPDNNWHKYHIQQEPNTIRHVDEQMRLHFSPKS